MLSLHRILRFKELSHSLYQYLFVLLYLELCLLIKSVKQILFLLLNPAIEIKSKLIPVKAPADIILGALLMVCTVSPLATNWSLDWELPVVMVGNNGNIIKITTTVIVMMMMMMLLQFIRQTSELSNKES